MYALTITNLEHEACDAVIGSLSETRKFFLSKNDALKLHHMT